jgi:hypothetical protein
MNSFEKIKQLMAAAQADAEKCYENGNKAAGSRLRKVYLEIKSAASAGRNEVSQLKRKGSE